MTSRNPWWYSGDDEVGSESAAAGDESILYDAAADDSVTAAADEPETAPADDGPEAAPRAADWSALIVGAQRMVEWATDRVMAPHAEHANPRDYPTCVVCRTMVLLGEVPQTADDASDAPERGTEQADPVAPSAIQWIPIRGEVPEP